MTEAQLEKKHVHAAREAKRRKEEEGKEALESIYAGRFLRGTASDTLANPAGLFTDTRGYGGGVAHVATRDLGDGTRRVFPLPGFLGRV